MSRGPLGVVVPAEAALELRFLGEMEIVRGGGRLELPPSRKTRALLAYLALSSRPHRGTASAASSGTWPTTPAAPSAGASAA